MKRIVFILFLLSLTQFSCKTQQIILSDINSLPNIKLKKDSLFKKNIEYLVEEIEFMYGYDQIIREYTTFKTFDKSETDRIENLSDSLRKIEMKNRKFLSDSIRKTIWRNYINPKDNEHTIRMMEITRKYGFPSINRIKKHYHQEFIDPEFNPLILLIHSPKEHWNELKIIMKQELKEERISKCTYGYVLWHITGRKSLQPMLDNGFEMVENNGKTILKSTCK